VIPSAHWLYLLSIEISGLITIEDKTPGTYSGNLVGPKAGVKNHAHEHWNWYLIFFHVILVVNKWCSQLLKLGKKCPFGRSAVQLQ